MPGVYESTVGLVSLGQIGSRVARMLQQLDIDVLAYDPFCDADKAASLGVTLCDLPHLFAESDVVSLHIPWLKETEGMITRELMASMKPGATLINTARGKVLDEPGLIEVLEDRPDLFAVLDVTYPEPPKPDSPLYTLDNVMLSPHIAGSTGKEVRRMGRYMIDEFDRYMNNEPLRYEVTPKVLETMA